MLKALKLKCLVDKKGMLKIERECAEFLRQNNFGNVVVLVMMNGAFIFAADVLRMANWRGEVYFMNASSYSGTKQNSSVKLSLIQSSLIKNKRVIILEDIVDTGKTMAAVAQRLKDKGAKTVEVITMLMRDGVKRPEIVDTLNYGLRLEHDAFVVGYGLDFNGAYRGLDYLGCLKEI